MSDDSKINLCTLEDRELPGGRVELRSVLSDLLHSTCTSLCKASPFTAPFCSMDELPLPLAVLIPVKVLRVQSRGRIALFKLPVKTCCKNMGYDNTGH